MQSNTFVELARTIARKDRKVFDELLEFEKTKRIRTKTRMNFTIDSNIASQFSKHCRKKGYNMSAKVEESMRKIINEEGEHL